MQTEIKTTIKLPSFEIWMQELKNTAIDFVQTSPLYEWVSDDNPYDHSGDVRLILPENKLDYINNIEINEWLDCFIDQLYTGQRIPTFESGCGWNFESYGSYLQYKFEHELIDRILNLSSFIFPESVNEDEWDEIKYDLVDDFIWENDIYPMWIYNPLKEFDKNYIINLLTKAN